MDRNIAALGYALQDSENTCKMGDLSPADQSRYFDRAAALLRWIEFHGITLAELQPQT